MTKHWCFPALGACLLILALGLLPACSEDDDDPTGPGNGDTTAPVVAGIDPSDGDSDVPLDETITVTFSEPMDPDTDDGNVTLSHGAITAQTWTDSRTLSITHGAWSEATRVTVTLAAGFADVAGNTLGQAFAASFWTRSATLAFLESVPADAATGVNRDASIRLLFSTDMNESTLESGVTITGGGTHAFTVAGGDGNWYTLDPVDRLPAGTLVTVTITTAVRSGAGQNLPAEVSFSFTTGAAVDETPPVITGFTPASGSVIPNDQGSVSVTFSEPVDITSFAPTAMNAQFLLVLADIESEPVWSEGNTVVTVPLPATLPDGLPLEVRFAGYADENGVVQPAESEWSVTVAGAPDFYPATDGRELTFMGTFARGNPGEPNPVESGPEVEYFKFEARATAGDWNLWFYEDAEYTMPDDYEIYRKAADGISWIGFGEDDGSKDFVEMLFASPLKIVPFPLTAGYTWTASTTVTTPDGTFDAVLAGEVLSQADLPFDLLDGELEFPVFWSDAWSVRTTMTVTVMEEPFFTEVLTAWYAPGVGEVRETAREDRMDPEDDPGWEEWDLWFVPDDFD